MTASSLLVPMAGVLTQPVLAQALGVEGRGALAAALAPSVLAISVATLGLPDALVYFLAKYPAITRRALGWASAISVGIGAICLGSTILAVPFLSAGDAQLGSLIVLAMILAVPALLVGVLRGAATGRQMWARVAAERLVNTSTRVVAFVGLWWTGELTLLSALLVSLLAPLVSAVVYVPLFRPAPPPAGPAGTPVEPEGGVVRPLVSFGSRVWVGAVAEMLLARTGQILMTPLAGVVELGYLSVAITISDLPLVVALAIQATLFGVNSRQRDAGRLTSATRMTLLVAALGCLLLGATLPAWIGPLFGTEFRPAVVPTLVLLASALVCIPGLLAATGVSAWGRPGLRSIGLALTLGTYLGLFVLVVPVSGALGAAWAGLAANLVMTVYMTAVAGRVMGVPARDFLLVRRSDVARTGREARRLLRTLRLRAHR